MRLPFPQAPDGYSYVRQQLPGGEYTSTGWFANGKVDARGRGRSISNCAGVATLMFDIDVVSVLTEARRAAGQVTEEKVAERKQHMHNLPDDIIDRYKNWMREEVFATMTAAVGLPPTTVVDTGWGFHLHYRVAADVCKDTAGLQNIAKLCIAEANRLAMELGRTLKRRLEHLSPWDNTHDVGARLCRIPGTWNVKCADKPRMCEVVTGGDPHTVIDRTHCARIQVRLGDPGLFEVPTRKKPRKHKNQELDFRTKQLADGRTWQQVVDLLEVGESLKVVCPFGGNSVGSGWFTKESEGRSRYNSAPANTTWWNSHKTEPRSKGRAELQVNQHNKPLNSTLNLKALLEQDGNYDLWYDEFTETVRNGTTVVDEITVTEMLVVMERDYGWMWAPADKRRYDMIALVANARRRNPVGEYLDSIKWDGQPRAERLFIEGCGVQDTQLHRAYALRFLVSLVARALQPGCKCDTSVVIEGPQAWGKSTFFRELVDIPGLPNLYSDTRIDVSSKDSFMQIYSAWLYEDAELCGHTSAGRDSRKNFLSSATDTFRPPYGRTLRTYKRHTVLVGTTNNSRFLDDPTGSRRYWVLSVGRSQRKTDKLDLEWIRTNRMQLFAEAVHHYRAGVQWWLTQEEERMRGLQNADHQYRDWFTECAEDVYNANAGGLPSGFRMAGFANAIPFTAGVCSQKHGRKLREALLAVGFEYNHSHAYQRTYYRPTVQMPDVTDNGLHVLDSKPRPEGGVVKLAARKR